MVPPTAKVTLPTLLYLIQIVSHKHAQKAWKVDTYKVDIPMKIDRQFIKRVFLFYYPALHGSFPSDAQCHERYPKEAPTSYWVGIDIVRLDKTISEVILINCLVSWTVVC